MSNMSNMSNMLRILDCGYGIKRPCDKLSLLKSISESCGETTHSSDKLINEGDTMTNTVKKPEFRVFFNLPDTMGKEFSTEELGEQPFAHYLASLVENEITRGNKERVRKYIFELTGYEFDDTQLDCIEKVSAAVVAAKLNKRDKEVLHNREKLAAKLLQAMNNGKVFFRWTDAQGEWQELTPYSLFANTFDGAEFKFEVVVTHKDIVDGKL